MTENKVVFTSLSEEKVELVIQPNEKVQDVCDKLAQKLNVNSSSIQLIYNDFLDKADIFPNIPQGETVIFQTNEVNDADENTIPDENEYLIPQSTKLEIPTQLPPDFAEKVARIMELGFTKEDVEKALKVTYFYEERAIDLLLKGEPIPDTPIPYVYDGDFDRKEILKSKYASDLTEEQRKDLLELANKFPKISDSLIIQYFDAVSCNVDAAIAILQNISSF